MQALVPPPSSTGLDYTQRLQSRTVELEAELAAIRRRLNLEMDTTAQVEKKLVDTLGVLSDLNMEVTRLDLALKDTDEEVSLLKERLDLEAVTLSNALRAVSVRDIEIERLTFALKDKDNELESVRDEHRTQIDKLMEEIERLTRKNKKRIKAAELRWLIDGHTNVLDAHRTAILQVREAIDQNKETLSAAQREMLATLDRHDGLISKAFGCIDNHSIYKQQQSIDNLWLYVQGIAAHINTGSSQENP